MSRKFRHHRSCKAWLWLQAKVRRRIGICKGEDTERKLGGTGYAKRVAGIHPGSSPIEMPDISASKTTLPRTTP